MKRLFGILMAAAIVGLPASVRADVVSTFNTDMEGWTGNRGTTQVTHGSGAGNPLGYLDFLDDRGGITSVVAPESFLGDWSDLDECGSIQYQHRIFDTNDDTDFYTHAVHISGGLTGLTTATWTGDTPVGETPWTTFTVPLIEGFWALGGAGDWADLLANVTSLAIRIEVVSNGGTGPGEHTGIDNVRLITSTCVRPCAGLCEQLDEKLCEIIRLLLTQTGQRASNCCGTSVAFPEGRSQPSCEVGISRRTSGIASPDLKR